MRGLPTGNPSERGLLSQHLRDNLSFGSSEEIAEARTELCEVGVIRIWHLEGRIFDGDVDNSLSVGGIDHMHFRRRCPQRLK